MSAKKTSDKDGSVTWYDGQFSIEMLQSREYVNIHTDGNDYAESVYDFPVSLLEKFIEDRKNDT